MKGVGYYDDRAYYPSSSNLSAFAQPFSVNKTASMDVAAPYVDLAESTDVIPASHFPVHSCSYGYDFFSNPVREMDSTPSLKTYGYSGSQVVDPLTSQLPQFKTLGLAPKDTFANDQSSNSIKPGLLETQPYYPSYISPSIHVASPSAAPDHWSTLDESNKSSEIGYSGQRVGFWSQFVESNRGYSKHVEAGGSFCSKETNLTGPVIEENLVNQGCQDVKASDNVKVLQSTSMMGWEKPGVPIIADQLDDKSCWWQTASSLPFDLSSTCIQASPSVSHETSYESPLNLVADSGSHHSSYTASSDKHLRQHDKRSLVNAESSAPITGIDVGFNAGNIAVGVDLGTNITTIMKETYPLPSPGSTNCFDLGQLCMHLERNEPTSSNNIMLSDNHVSTGAVDYILKARHGFLNPQESLNNLRLGFSTDEGANSIEKSSDGVDRCNPAVDSPCWKGAPASHFSPFEGSEALRPEYVKSNKENLSSQFQGPQNFLLGASNNVEMACENSKNDPIDNETDYLEKGLAGSSRKFSLANFVSEEKNLDGAVSAGYFDSKPIYDCGLQHLDDISEMRENSMPSNKSTYDSESRFSNYEQQIIEENKCVMSQKQHNLCGGCADAKSNVNEYFEYGASHAAEPSHSSPPSVVATRTALKESAANVSAPKINIQMLVDTMHNLSELLLFHCLDDACELKERDRNVLSNVISNLNTCALKNAERMFPGQDCIFTQPNPFKCARESHEHQQNARFERPHLTRVDPEVSKVEHDNLPVQEVKSHHFESGKQGKFSDSFPTKGDAEMMKEDSMVKALKRILSENFHDEEGAESEILLYKNLWLEAEAAICSINYRARYNQMKIEMEKCHKRKDNDLDVKEQSKLDDPNLSAAQSSAAKVNIVQYPNYSAKNFPALNAANLKEFSGLKFSTDLNKPCTLTPEDNGSQNLDSFIQDSAVSGLNKESGESEASTKPIFYGRNSGDEKSCVNTVKPKELLISGASHALDTTDKLASGQTDTEDQVGFTQISPNPGKNEADDYVSSVMSRFDILKSRVEDSCTDTANPEELPSFEFSHSVDPVDKLASGQTDSEKQVNFTQVSPIAGQNKTDAYVSSVMARFHILKSHVEDSSSISSEGQLLDGVIFAGNGPECAIIRNASEADSLNSSVNSPIMHLSSYTDVEQSTPKEFDLNLEDDQEIQARGTYKFGFQLPTYYSDGFSSEWEHVKMEELTGQSFKP